MSNAIPARRMTHIMSEYPLSLWLVPSLKELNLYDYTQTDGEVILVLPVSDEQITAIQNRKLSQTVVNIIDQDRDLVIIDCKKGLVLELDQSQLALGNMLEPAHEDWYTILLTLPITSDQLQIIQEAMNRAEIYRLTHDEEDNLIIPPVSPDTLLTSIL